MIPLDKLEHILEYALQQKQSGAMACRVPPADMVEIMERMLAGEGNSSAIPNGWKLVPVEPTEAMIEAGDVHMDGVSNLGLAWDEMLEASPLPPAGGDRG